MIKKLLICSLLCGVAFAKGGYMDGHHGGYKNGEHRYNLVNLGGERFRAVTVNEAKKLRDDTPVALIGNITKQLSHEKYLFVDKTSASITVEIDDDDWNGLEVYPDMKVCIVGEVDKDFGRTKIDVDDVLPLR